VSNESTSGESGDRPNRSRPQHASHLGGLNLPHPTSPADTNDTEMIDIRPSEAKTRAIPLAAPQPVPPVQQAAPTEPIRQLSFGQLGPGEAAPPISVATDIEHSALDGRTDHLGLVDYDMRTNPIPQQTIPPAPPRPQERPPSNRPNPGTQQPFSSLDLPQPEQDWRLGGPEHPALQPTSSPIRGSAPSGDSARPPMAAPDAKPAKSSRADRPLSARERKTWLFAGIGAAVVVAVGIGVTLFMVGGKGGNSAASGGSPSMVSALTAGKGTPPPSAVPPSASAPTTVANLAPLIPGYQVVQVPSRGAAFDAPRNWRLDPAGTATWGTAPDTVELAGLVQDGKGYCPNSVRTNAFLTMSPQSDPAAATADIGTRLAKIGWPAATGTTQSKAEPLTSLDGQLHGSFAETDGTSPPPAPGCAGSFAVYTFAFPGENGNFVMTIAADTGVDRAVDRATARQILASIRPLPDK